MGSYTYLLIVIFIIVHGASISCAGETSSLRHTPEDAKLNFTQLAIKYGHECEEFSVTTPDGYILKMFHIPGNKSRPVFLMHGFLDSADTYIIRANGSLSLTLARAGYDVWAGNMRGNKYSRRHTKLNPDKDKKFWNFSLHEIGTIDLPAMIDFILKKTSTKQLSAVGHSEGTTVFYVLGATRPLYNNKIKLMISLAPVAFLQNSKIPFSTLLAAGPIINGVLKTTGQEEFFGNHSSAVEFLKVLCTTKLIGNPVCETGFFLTVDGRDDTTFANNFLAIVVGHFPSGSSRKNGNHLIQISNRRKFAQYDYGPAENFAIYKTFTPPEYDLRKVAMRIALFVGQNDKIATVPDAEMLRHQLPNVVDYRVLEYKDMNHVDFVFGANMDEYLFPYIFQNLHTFQ